MPSTHIDIFRSPILSSLLFLFMYSRVHLTHPTLTTSRADDRNNFNSTNKNFFSYVPQIFCCCFFLFDGKWKMKKSEVSLLLLYSLLSVERQIRRKHKSFIKLSTRFSLCPPHHERYQPFPWRFNLTIGFYWRRAFKEKSSTLEL